MAQSGSRSDRRRIGAGSLSVYQRSVRYIEPEATNRTPSGIACADRNDRFVQAGVYFVLCLRVDVANDRPFKQRKL
jgi:hypothetical protein